jgi:hypothetical protein
MSLFNSVAELFRTPTVASPQLEAKPQTPAPEKQEEVPPGSPLDVHKDFWQPSKDAAPGSEPVNFKADPQKLMESASKIDFAKVIKPEQLAAIQAGGDGATKALVEMLQATSQTVYAQSAFAATKIAESAVAQAQDNFAKQLPALLRKQGLSDGLTTENPALAHPAIQPMIEAMQTQFASKYPNATSAELLTMARAYISDAGKAFMPQEKQSKTAAGKKAEVGGYDWSKFLG